MGFFNVKIIDNENKIEIKDKINIFQILIMRKLTISFQIFPR